jgi:hypothetical protein
MAGLSRKHDRDDMDVEGHGDGDNDDDGNYCLPSYQKRFKGLLELSDDSEEVDQEGFSCYDPELKLKRKTGTDESSDDDLSDLMALKRVKIIDQDIRRCIPTRSFPDVDGDDNDINFLPINNVLREFEMLRRFRRGLKSVSSPDMRKCSSSSSVAISRWGGDATASSSNIKHVHHGEPDCFPP